MNKPFKTFDEQIKILQSKGVRIKNIEKAKSLLAHFNYYNLINGYKTPFIIKNNKHSNTNNVYKKGTTLEEIYNLHELDKELKIVVFAALLRFEKLFKTSCAYHFSRLHQNELYPYLRVENYSNSQHLLNVVLNNISKFSNYINKENTKIHGKKPIKHYIKKHEHIPFWVFVNFLTFGDISFFYSALEEHLQNQIAKDFGERYQTMYNTTEKLGSIELRQILRLSNYFRNVCAHDEVMYSFNLKKPVQTSIFNKFFNQKCTGKNLHDLILTLKLVLPKNEHKELIKSINKIRAKYKNKFTTISIDYIFYIAGFENANT